MKRQISWTFGAAVLIIVLAAASLLLYNAAHGGVKGDGKAGEVKSLAGQSYTGLPSSGK